MSQVALSNRHPHAAPAPTLAALVDCMEDAVVGIDLDGRVSFWNAGAERLLGYSAAHILGQPFAMVATGEDDSGFAAILAGGRAQSGETDCRTRDGSTVPVAVSASPVCDVGGTLGGVVVVLRDLTETRRLAQQATLARTMNAIGQLAGGVAHEFNNVLMAISGYAQMALTVPDVPSEAQDDMQEILRASARASALTKRLLTFSRGQVVQPRVMGVSALMSHLEGVLRSMLDADTAFLCGPPADGSIVIDPLEFEQLVVNLFANSLESMPDGGSVTVTTELVDLDEKTAECLGIADGSHLRLRVQDTGRGMSEETQERAFDAFFTTKCGARGAGLGLPIAYGIVQRAWGQIVLTSEPGVGTTVDVYLPRAGTSGRQHSAVGDESDARPRGTETVLVVEDDACVRDISVRLLRGLGYRVLEAVDGLDALRVAGAHKGPIHLAFTDVVMPGMGGPELAQRLAVVRPATKLLFASGYTGVAPMAGMPPGKLAFLHKPFSLDSLARTVRDVLDERNR